MDPFIWSILLLAIGLGLLVLELFIPSGGLLTVLAALCVLAGLVVGFTVSTRVGVILLSVTVVVVPLIVTAAVRIWPHTPIGRLVLLTRPNPDEVLPDSVQYRGLKSLIGHKGMCKSAMLPSGLVEIDGRTYDAVGEGEPIDPGAVVQVVDVRTNRLIVRLSDGELPGPPAASLPTEDGGSDDDILSRPIDSLGIEGLDEPLGDEPR